MKPGRQPAIRKAAATQNWKTQSLSFLRELGIILGAVLLLNSFVVASFEVPTGSMEDTVKIGDRLIVNKFLYGGSTPYTIPLTSIRIPHFRLPGFREVKRGDVIVFDWPGPRDEVQRPLQMWYLKRCIGLPGDTVRIMDRQVVVNNKIVPDPPHSKFLNRSGQPADYHNPAIFPSDAPYNEDNYGPVIVPKKGMYLVLTPHTLPAWDVFIRREGHTTAIRGDSVVIDGREVTGYEIQRDYAFAMGDNRDNSLDSRFWGFVPVEDIIGTPIFVYWSWNPGIPLTQIVDKLASVNLARIGTLIR